MFHVTCSQDRACEFLARVLGIRKKVHPSWIMILNAGILRVTSQEDRLTKDIAIISIHYSAISISMEIFSTNWLDRSRVLFLAAEDEPKQSLWIITYFINWAQTKSNGIFVRARIDRIT